MIIRAVNVLDIVNEQLRIRAQFVITLALSRFKAHLKMLNIKIQTNYLLDLKQFGYL